MVFLFSMFIIHSVKIRALNLNSECFLMSPALGTGMEMLLGSIPLLPPKIGLIRKEMKERFLICY